MALGSRFGEQICRIAALGISALESSFGQFSGPALRQLREAALEFWEASLGRGFR